MIRSVDDLTMCRPELLSVLRLGTVRWWKDDNGHGRITADDGEVLFASFAHIVSWRRLTTVVSKARQALDRSLARS
jgi:hypothetical protein